MIARASALIGALSGSLGSVTAKNTRTGLVLAHRPAKINQQTGRQLAQRADYNRALGDWRALSNADRTAWRRLASTFPHTNSLGVSRALSGFQFFMKMDLLVLHLHLGTFVVPPAGVSTSQGTGFDLNFTVGGPFTITFNQPAFPPEVWTFIYLGRSHQTNRPRFFDNFTFANTTTTFQFFSTTDIRLLFEILLGEPQDGEWVYVQLFSWDVNKLPSPRISLATQMHT